MIKILAIDDKQDNLVSISALLKNSISDCSVITADSGAEGIKKARAELPDTILLDIIMPGMDGYEVCRKLKSDEKTKHIPVIMITAIKTDSESRVKGLDLGADAFLSKPVEGAELSAQVSAMLRIKYNEDALRKQEALLRESHMNLEKKISDRTSELMKANQELALEIEERKRAEEALRSERDKFRGVINAIGEGLYIADQDLAIAYHEVISDYAFHAR